MNEILEMMAKNEEGIARLYGLYAERMPEHSSLWTELAGEEMQHASWIRAFNEGVGEGSLVLDEKRFPREALQTYAEYLNINLAKARQVGEDIAQYFVTALYIEESLIEAKFFQVIDTGSKDFDKLVLRLKLATLEHIERLREYWEGVKEKHKT